MINENTVEMVRSCLTELGYNADEFKWIDARKEFQLAGTIPGVWIKTNEFEDISEDEGVKNFVIDVTTNAKLNLTMAKKNPDRLKRNVGVYPDKELFDIMFDIIRAENPQFDQSVTAEGIEELNVASRAYKELFDPKFVDTSADTEEFRVEVEKYKKLLFDYFITNGSAVYDYGVDKCIIKVESETEFIGFSARFTNSGKYITTSLFGYTIDMVDDRAVYSTIVEEFPNKTHKHAIKNYTGVLSQFPTAFAFVDAWFTNYAKSGPYKDLDNDPTEIDDLRKVFSNECAIALNEVGVSVNNMTYFDMDTVASRLYAIIVRLAAVMKFIWSVKSNG